MSPSAVSDINANSNKHIDNCNAQLLHGVGKSNVACPLCETDVLAERAEMEAHLMKTHNVKKEGLHRLLALVSFPKEIASSSKTEPANRIAVECSAEESESESAEATAADEHSEYRCQICLRQLPSLDALYAHQTELDHFEVKQTPNGPGYLCWKKGCNQYFRTVEAVQTHFREIHDKANRLTRVASAGNHCNATATAAATGSVNSTLNASRLTTFCAICTRNFRSVMALRKHVETIHQNQDNSLADESTIEVDVDVNVNVNGLHESADDNRLFEKVMDNTGRALDLARPFKCEVCQESFAQHSLLLSHFKSVSHLHEMKLQKRSVINENRTDLQSTNSQETLRETTGNSNTVYKCNLCKLSYADSLSLGSHVKSQAHQNRLSRLYELIAIGEYDLSKPLIENPDDIMKVLWNSLMLAAQKSSTIESFATRNAANVALSPNMPNTSMAMQNKQHDATAQQLARSTSQEKSAGDLAPLAVRNSLRLPSSFRKSLMQVGLDHVTQYLESVDDDEDDRQFECAECDKSFSSQLLLKCHCELLHRDFMHDEPLTQVATCIQEELDKRMHCIVAQDAADQDNQVFIPSPSHSPCRAAQSNVAAQEVDDIATCSTSQLPVAALAQSNAVACKTTSNNRKTVSLAQQTSSLLEKRARTRITDEQLKVLRAHFNLNCSPCDDEILRMSNSTGLAQKVIKHWFRNTLFKERQRNKDSPYNFSVPPVTCLNLEEYERTGEIKVAALEQTNDNCNADDADTESCAPKKADQSCQSLAQCMQAAETCTTQTLTLVQQSITECAQEQLEDDDDADTHESLSFTQSECTDDRDYASVSQPCDERNALVRDKLSEGARSVDNESYSTTVSNRPQRDVFKRSFSAFASSATSASEHNANSAGKRANRTRFSDEQLAVLQQYFESRNAYPKDEELEQLSRRLALNPRVIVVWFQNQRQKKHRAKITQSNGGETASDSCAQQQSNGGSVSPNAMLEALSRVVVKRRYDDEELVVEEDAAHSEDELSDAETDRHGDAPVLADKRLGPPRKRLRTTILPEQLDCLYQQYQQDSNPTRKRIEEIAETVNLRKRVVQVWFQNARARTRKELQAQIMKRSEATDRCTKSSESLKSPTCSQVSPNGPLLAAAVALAESPRLTCSHCPAQFRARSALSAHFKAKHAEVVECADRADAQGPDHIFSTIDDVLATPAALKAESAQASLSRIASDAPAIRPSASTHSQSDDVLPECGRSHEVNDNSRSRSRDSSPDESFSERLSSDMHVPNGIKQHKGSGDAHKRTRTQLSVTQIRMMKAIFKDYRTPTMHECELLGNEIGLARRVVQVWYQNARAKERKAKVFGAFGISKKDDDEDRRDASAAPSCTRCTLCNVEFVSAAQPNGETMQQHLFSSRHLQLLRHSFDSCSGTTCKSPTEHAHADETTATLDNRNHAVQKAAARAKRLKLLDTSDLQSHSHSHRTEFLASKGDSSKEPVSKSSPHAPASVSDASETGSCQNAAEQSSVINPAVATASLLAVSAAAANSVNLLSSLLSPQLNLALPLAPSLPGLSVMPYMYAAAAAAAAAAINTANSNSNGNASSSNSSSPLLSNKCASTLPSWQQAQLQLDAINYGVPVNLLQVPAAALKSIEEQIKCLDRNAYKCTYTLDASSLKELAASASGNLNLTYVETKAVDVGYICRACTLVFPKYDSCANHQRTSCTKLKEISTDCQHKIILLEQLQYRCKVCNNAYNSTLDFVQHCTADRSAHHCLLNTCSAS